MDSLNLLPPRVPLASRPLGIVGSALTARRNVLELIPEIALRQPMVSGRLGIRWHMVMDPGALRRVLKDRVEDYPKSTVTKLLLEPAIGDSLFIAEGAQWRWQRLAAAPAFAARNVEALAPVMTAAAEASAARIAAAAQPFDAYAEMVAATFDVISDVTFSGDEGFDRDAVHHAINGYIASTARVSVLDVLGAPPWVPRPGRIFSGQGLRETKKLADRAIAERARRGPRVPPDLLDLLRSGVDPETGRSMNASELRDNLLTFIVAGHETTALTLSWALYLCAFDPAVQARASAAARAPASPPPNCRACLTSSRSCRNPCGFTRLPPSSRAPPAAPTAWAGGGSNPATPSCCRSTRCTATTCCGRTPTPSTPSASPPAWNATAFPSCPSAAVPASASAPASPCRRPRSSSPRCWPASTSRWSPAGCRCPG